MSKRIKRPETYESKVRIKESVTFEDLMKVAVNHDPKKKSTKKKKPQ